MPCWIYFDITVYDFDFLIFSIYSKRKSSRQEHVCQRGHELFQAALQCKIHMHISGVSSLATSNLENFGKSKYIEQLRFFPWVNRSRSSHRKCSVRKGVLWNFAKFTGKQLSRSLFLIKLHASQAKINEMNIFEYMKCIELVFLLYALNMYYHPVTFVLCLKAHHPV